METIDFTECPRVQGRAYNGANGKKIAVRYEGSIWMLKFPLSATGKRTELSYTNSCFSEYIASTIANMIGLPSHVTRLGTFVNGKTKVVCACRDFTEGVKTFYDFCSIKNTILESESNGTGTELEDILDAIDRQEFADPVELRAHFWKMFAVDAFLGNFDRHNGNWGFLVDPATCKSEIAPAFDFGSCLLPQAGEGVLRKILAVREELDARIYDFPTSAIKENDRKINYVDFVQNNKTTCLKQAIGEIVPMIDFISIDKLIDETPYLSELQRKFYKVYLRARYDALFA